MMTERFGRGLPQSRFGYRKGRKTADALSKIWREVEAGIIDGHQSSVEFIDETAGVAGMRMKRRWKAMRGPRI
jgi:hypothetical protein